MAWSQNKKFGVIMIKNNEIHFGYGTVLIRTYLNKIEFYEINNPLTINEHPLNMDIADSLMNSRYYKYDDDMYKLMNELRVVSGACTIIFRGARLDFSNYQAGSIEALKRSLGALFKAVQPLIAC